MCVFFLQRAGRVCISQALITALSNMMFAHGPGALKERMLRAAKRGFVNAA
jgi:hypothetical protein